MRPLVLIITIVLGFGLSYGLGKHERVDYANKQCVERRDSRQQGNVRAEHQIKLEEALILTNQAGEAQVKYIAPAAIRELEKRQGEVKPLPPIKC